LYIKNWDVISFINYTLKIKGINKWSNNTKMNMKRFNVSEEVILVSKFNLFILTNFKYRCGISCEPQSRVKIIYCQKGNAEWAEIKGKRRSNAGSKFTEELRSSKHCSIQIKLLHSRNPHYYHGIL